MTWDANKEAEALLARICGGIHGEGPDPGLAAGEASRCPRCLASALQRARDEALEYAAKLVQAQADHYPTTAWPEAGTSRDCIAASCARHFAKTWAARIREHAAEEASNWEPGDDCGCDEDGPFPGTVCPVGHLRAAPVEPREPAAEPRESDRNCENRSRVTGLPCAKGYGHTGDHETRLHWGPVRRCPATTPCDNPYFHAVAEGCYDVRAPERKPEP